MNSIDDIMYMLSWDKPLEVQQQGIELSKNIKCINVFLQPCHKEHNKNVWDNCAIILSQRSDQELKPYISELLEWLQDMNWPGAECIYQRLMDYKDSSWLIDMLDDAIDLARKTDEELWLNSDCFFLPKHLEMLINSRVSG